MIDEIIDVITLTLCSDFKDGKISMGEAAVPAEEVKKVFRKLDMFDIQFFLESFQKSNVVGKPMPYIRASLFNNHRISRHYYDNRVRTDSIKYLERNQS
jgi:hypothetical protein